MVSMTLRNIVAAAILIALAAVPMIAAALEQPFYVTLFSRILIFGLAALGLNLILGFGGLVSFGHAMYIGIGAYAVGILSYHGITNGWTHLAAALAFRRFRAPLETSACYFLRRGGVGGGRLPRWCAKAECRSSQSASDR